MADADGVAVGHVAFSPVAIDGTVDFQGYILAPLAVGPDYQRRRIGSQLIGSCMQLLTDLGDGILFVYGDPKYYGRLGFGVESSEGYVPP